jgi:predicted methyltransferase
MENLQGRSTAKTRKTIQLCIVKATYFSFWKSSTPFRISAVRSNRKIKEKWAENEEKFSSTQYGFRIGKSTRDCLAIL